MKLLFKNRLFSFLITFTIVTIVSAGAYFYFTRGSGVPDSFSGSRAMDDVRHQVSLGPRVPGSEAHRQVIEWMASDLVAHGWQVQVQEATMMGHPIKNVVAKNSFGLGEDVPWIIIGAHYDTRFISDQDPEPGKRSRPVPGANDGASGVAVLKELARVLPPDLEKDVWLVFFDAEDNGDIPGWDWILGSRAFVEALQETPDAVVIVDMVGDADLNIYMEQNSDKKLTAEIWAQASELGYADIFIPFPRYSILDDHTPFLRVGIPAVDIIDFDYPYWHTTEDTVDKVSAQSLQIVGEVLTSWLTDKW